MGRASVTPGECGADPLRLVVIAGPTGTGKSDLAVDLAERLGGEIVNADSMQRYRGMDIGTAKLTVAERRGVPHHQLDVLDVTETASVAAYQSAARTTIDDILASRRTPILVGGSGLYLRAVIDEMDFPPSDPAVRRRWESELADAGVGELHRRLAALDPAAAEIIEANDGRRIVRALEVIELTGGPFRATIPAPGPPRYGAAMICLDREPADLDDRLDRRVRTMMDRGFLDEVRALDAIGLRRGMTASRALGYRQMLAALDGTVSAAQAAVDTVAATRRFVRRQRSWFRRDRRWHRLDAADPALRERACDLIAHGP